MENPKMNTDNNNSLELKKAACEDVITGAARIIVHEIGATIPQMVDRMLTFSAAQLCNADGRSAASALFRNIADQIDSGVFSAVERKVSLQ